MNILDHEGIANEAKLHEIASLIDNDFFMESIKEQIFDGLDCSTTDYLREFEIKVRNIVEKYDENDYSDVLQFQQDLHHYIIDWIGKKYDIDINYEEEEVLRIAKQLYQFFVMDLKDAVLSFLVSFIRENYKSILNNIDDEMLNLSSMDPEKPKNEQYEIILISNLGTVVEFIAGSGITFEEFIRYSAVTGDIRSVVELNNGSHVLSISDSSEMFNTIIRNLKDDEYDPNIIINLSQILIASLNIKEGDDISE